MSAMLSEQSGNGKHGRKHLFGGGRSQAAVEAPMLPGHESLPESLAKREHTDAELEVGCFLICNEIICTLRMPLSCSKDKCKIHLA